MDTENWYEGKCPICGKEICIPDKSSWAYARSYHKSRESKRTYYLCSWHCLQQMPEKHVRGRPTQIKDKILQGLREGLSDNKIAMRVGCTTAAVKYWRDRIDGREDDNAGGDH